MLPPWITDLIAIAPWGAAVVLIVFVVVKLWPIARKLGHLVDDLIGEPERPGIPARPGLMERVSTIETTQDGMRTKLDAVHHEVFPNSGNSLRDRVDGIDRKLDNDHRRLSEVEDTVKGAIETKVTEVIEVIKENS